MDRIPLYTPPPPMRLAGCGGPLGAVLVSLGLSPFVLAAKVGTLSLYPSVRLGTLGIVVLLLTVTVGRGVSTTPHLRARIHPNGLLLIHGLFWVILGSTILWLAFLIGNATITFDLPLM